MQHQYNGVFIAVEGIDGVGKTTVIEALRLKLTELGIVHVITKEPGGSDFSQLCRQVLLNDVTADVEATAKLLLVNAARYDNVSKVILPALLDGKVVITDRFTLSSLAYQRGASSLELLNSIGSQGLQPDLTVLLDASTDVSAKRLALRSGDEELNHFDKATEEERQALRKVMLDWHNKHQNISQVFCVNSSKEAVCNKVTNAIIEFINTRIL